MTDFRTNINVKKADFNISHQDRIFCIGSCFAKKIGRLLKDHKFQILVNPSGILYNPVSIQKKIELILNRDSIAKEDLFPHNNLWQHYDFHSQFSHRDKNEAFRQITQHLAKAEKILKKRQPLDSNFRDSSHIP